jgi:hypothetical protein
MYAKIKGLKYFPCGQFTSTQAQKFCNKDEIKFFDMKKQKNELWLIPYALTAVQRMEQQFRFDWTGLC